MQVNQKLTQTMLLLSLIATFGWGCKSRHMSSGVLDDTDDGKDVSSSIRKALTYIEETQVSELDKTTDGIRLQGEWPSYVRGSIANEARVHALYDSNAFVPMFTLYPLFMIDGGTLPQASKHLASIEERTLKLLDKWYRQPNGEVNFWPTIDGMHGPQQIFETLPFSRLLSPIFDITNDADDTAVYYMTMLKLKAIGQSVPISPNFPDIYARWTDINRVRQDAREAEWKPEPTGAFLTWLSDENKPYNRQPISFYLANNVDCVVISNALYSIGLNARLNGGSTDIKGYEESCLLAREVIFKNLYPQCAFYYPPQWLFPYAVSRAFRDGGNACLGEPLPGQTERPMGALAATIIAAQQEDGSWKDSGPLSNLKDDVISVDEPEFRGDATVYATALNVITLENIGSKEWPSADAARSAVTRGVQYLLANGVSENGKVFWQGGVFFSSSVQEVARWKSRPYTTAVVLEALLKFEHDYADEPNADIRWPLSEAEAPKSWR